MREEHMHETEKDKILTELDEELLATKELQRQVQHAGVNLDEVSLPDVDTDAMISRLNQSVEDLLSGAVSPEDVEARNAPIEEQISALDERYSEQVRESGDPGLVTALDAENEAKAEHFPHTAQLLVRDAAQRAAARPSK